MVLLPIGVLFTMIALFIGLTASANRELEGSEPGEPGKR